MELSHNVYVTFILSILIILLFFVYIRNYIKKFAGLPLHHTLLYLAYCKVTGKIPKDVPLTSFFLQVIVHVSKQFTKEGLFMVYGPAPTLFIFSEEFIKVFINEKAAVDKPDEYKIVEDVLGPGLVTINGARWKNHRKLINPAFQLGALKDKVPLLNGHASALVKDFETLVNKPSVNLLYSIKQHCFNALSESVFSLKQTEENKAANQRYFCLVDNLLRMTVYRIIYPWLRWKFMLNFFSTGRKYLKHHREHYAFTKDVILEMKKYVVSNKKSGEEIFTENLEKSFTYILLQHHLKDPSFTFDDLYGETNTFMMAGYDTVSYTLMWCLFMLGLHPEVQEKAFNEVRSTSDNFITYEESCNFTYLHAVILETLRLYPTVPVFGRQLSRDVQSGPYKVHKGTRVLFLVYLWHRNPEIYPNPEIFDPERFLNNAPKKPWTHIPFAEGNRSCIGKQYSFIEMKIFLAYVLRQFKITSLDKMEDIPACLSFVLAPSKPIRMHITRRSNGA